MRFACESCGHPAVSLPVVLHPDAMVHCQGCGAGVATWAAFKQRATRIILLERHKAGATGTTYGPDPLDSDLLSARPAIPTAL
jgi:uncharacterized Zn finger protein